MDKEQVEQQLKQLNEKFNISKDTSPQEFKEFLQKTITPNFKIMPQIEVYYYFWKERTSFFIEQYRILGPNGKKKVFLCIKRGVAFSTGPKYKKMKPWYDKMDKLIILNALKQEKLEDQRLLQLHSNAVRQQEERKKVSKATLFLNFILKPFRKQEVKEEEALTQSLMKKDSLDAMQ